MLNTLIYDIDSNHADVVRSFYNQTRSGQGTVYREFFGFGIGYGEQIRTFCNANNVKVVIVPYRQIRSAQLENLILDDIACVVPYYVGSSQNTDNVTFSSTIRVLTTSEQATMRSLDFRMNETAPSWVCGKVGGLLANLMESGYTAWQARQILRQNCNAYDNWTIANGYGTLPNSITIPETIDPIFTQPVRFWYWASNGRMRFKFRNPSSIFDFAGLIITEDSIIQNRYTQAVTYSIDYGAPYGSVDFAFDANPDGVALVGEPIAPIFDGESPAIPIPEPTPTPIVPNIFTATKTATGFTATAEPPAFGTIQWQFRYPTTEFQNAGTGDTITIEADNRTVLIRAKNVLSEGNESAWSEVVYVSPTPIYKAISGGIV